MGLPNLGVWLQEEFLESQTWELVGFDCRTSTGLGGGRDSTLGGHTQGSVCIGTQEKER